MSMIYLVDTKSICHPDESWLQRVKYQVICPGCWEVYPGVRRAGVDVFVSERPDISAVNTVEPGGICIARREFLDLFADEVRQCLVLGQVFTAEGVLLEDYVTFVGERRLPVRGAESSYYGGKCGLCGSLKYWPAYPWYVLRSSFFEQPLYEAWGTEGLVLTEELVQRVERQKWKGIYITQLPLLDEPRDGVPQIAKDLQVIGNA